MPPERDLADIFNSTRWSVVAAAKAGDPAATAALDELFRIYWSPVYCFIRRRGQEAADAEDLVQDYFASLLRRGYLGETDKTKGRFRAFLLADLKLFLANAGRRERAEKRGGGAEVLSIDVDDAEQRYALSAAMVAEPDVLFDREWASEVFALARRQLARECEEQGKWQMFETLAPLLDQPPVDGVLATAAEALDSNVGAVKVALHRLRGRFAEALRSLVRDTVSDPRDAEAELRHLVLVWARSAEPKDPRD